MLGRCVPQTTLAHKFIYSEKLHDLKHGHFKRPPNWKKVLEIPSLTTFGDNFFLHFILRWAKKKYLFIQDHITRCLSMFPTLPIPIPNQDPHQITIAHSCDSRGCPPHGCLSDIQAEIGIALVFVKAVLKKAKIHPKRKGSRIRNAIVNHFKMLSCYLWWNKGISDIHSPKKRQKHPPPNSPPPEWRWISCHHPSQRCRRRYWTESSL